MQEKRIKEKILMQNSKGITLISLVVTIIVILILAGITISMTLGQNGIITKASLANEEYKIAQKHEEVEMNKVNAVGASAGENVGTVTNVAGETVATLIADGDNNAFPLPTGLNYVGGTVETGVVISTVSQGDSYKGVKDVPAFNSGNQWVWVPVSDASVMYEKQTATLTKTNVTTNRYSRSAILTGKIRRTPGTTSYREPDVVTSGTNYDGVASNRTAADSTRFTSLEAMAQALSDDYNNMIKSVEMYGGFYVGRYELGGTSNTATPTLVKGQTVLTGSQSANWYHLYAAARKLGSTTATSNMIYGCQWDVMCNFIANSGDKKDINNSITWGNHSNSTGDAETGKGTKQVSGYNEAWKANNLYDVAGNCYEFTMEAFSTDNRANRGGVFNNYGSSYPASSRGGFSPTSTRDNYGSRPTLILNP